MCITPKWNNLVWALAAIFDNTAGDEAGVFELALNSSWINYTPRSDTLLAHENIPIEIFINTADLDTGNYGVVIEFSHNAGQGVTTVPVDLIITTLDAPDVAVFAEDYSLEQNFPNPFNSSTSIQYTVQKAGMTELFIYDLMGRETMSLIRKYQPAGSYRISFDGSELPAGLYFYKIKSGEFSAVRKMLLIK